MKDNLKIHMNKILAGMSMGVVICLMPNAMLGQLAPLFGLDILVPFLSFSTTLMGLVIGLCIASIYKMDAASTCSLAISTMIAGGALKGFNEKGMLELSGSGDILNASLGAIIAIVIIFFIGDKLNRYKWFFLLPICIIVVGIITTITAGPVGEVTNLIGAIVSKFTELRPFTMSALIAISFATIIVSPISSVAVALLIGISGTGAAAAGVGISAVGIALAISAYPNCGLMTSIAHFFCSPKIQMANFVKRPKIIIPGLCSAALCSLTVPFFNLQGTSFSAGFGLSGLVSPLGHLGIVGFELNNVLITVLCYFILPFIASFFFVWLFTKVIKLVNEDDYLIDMN